MQIIKSKTSVCTWYKKYFYVDIFVQNVCNWSVSSDLLMSDMHLLPWFRLGVFVHTQIFQSSSKICQRILILTPRSADKIALNGSHFFCSKPVFCIQRVDGESFRILWRRAHNNTEDLCSNKYKPQQGSEAKGYRTEVQWPQASRTFSL